MDVSNPNGGVTTPPMAGGGGGVPDISMQDLPLEPTGNMPSVGGDMPQQQALDEMASLGIPNTPQGWTAYGKYKTNQRAQSKEGAEKSAAEESTINAVNLFDQQYQLQKQAIASARQKMSNPLSTGGFNQATGWVTSSPAGSLNSDLEVLQSNAMLDAMMQLKEASKTGATGLGSQTEKEGNRLIQSRGNLSGAQKAEDLKRYLDAYEKNLDISRENIITRLIYALIESAFCISKSCHAATDSRRGCSLQHTRYATP